MLWLPKWLRTDERPEEPDLSRRVFCFGLVGAVITLAAPALSLPEPRVDSIEFLDISLWGIPYHQNDAAAGSWLGLDRVSPVYGPLPSPARVREAINKITRH